MKNRRKKFKNFFQQNALEKNRGNRAVEITFCFISISQSVGEI